MADLKPCPFCGVVLGPVLPGIRRHPGGRVDCILAGITINDCDVEFWNRRVDHLGGEAELQRTLKTLADTEAAAIGYEKDAEQVFARMRAERQWVACSERMPPDEHDVLVFVAPDFCCISAWYEGKWAGLFEDAMADDITHWMPLPAPPGTAAGTDGSIR